MRDTPLSQDPRAQGVLLFIGSISSLMAAAMAGYLAVRFTADDWPPPGVPGPPAGFFVSTALLCLASVAIDRAYRGGKRRDGPALRSGLAMTTILVGAFVLTQGIVGFEVLDAAARRADADLYTFCICLLTALHAVHVLGGFVPLIWITRATLSGVPPDVEGVRLLAIYWHFLLAVWAVMLGLLYL